MTAIDCSCLHRDASACARSRLPPSYDPDLDYDPLDPCVCECLCHYPDEDCEEEE